jgi:hypothetical protein
MAILKRVIKYIIFAAAVATAQRLHHFLEDILIIEIRNNDSRHFKLQIFVKP